MIYNAEVSKFYVPDILAENHCARNWRRQISCFTKASSNNLKGTAMEIEKSTDKWSLTCFKSILKISHSNYL